MHRSQVDLQYYVSRAGDQVFAPPFVLDGMDMLVFVLEADPVKLNDLLNHELNDPWEQAFASRGVRHEYRATTVAAPATGATKKTELGWVALVLSEVKDIYPQVFKDYRKGTDPQKREEALAALSKKLGLDPGVDVKVLANVSAQQHELIVLIPVDDGGLDRDSGRTALWHVPIVLNDCAPAVLAGREVFGYPKQLATFEAEVGGRLKPGPWLAGGAGWDKVRVLGAGPVATPDTDKYTLGPVPVLEIAQGSGASPNAAANALITEQAQARLKQQVEFLFLRQFRDPEYTDRASYQAAVSGDITAGDGPFTDQLPALSTQPERFSITFPLAKGGTQLFSALGIKGAQGIVTPQTVFTYGTQQLVVTRGSIKWDKP
jgi:hypothetical protein